MSSSSTILARLGPNTAKQVLSRRAASQATLSSRPQTIGAPRLSTLTTLHASSIHTSRSSLSHLHSVSQRPIPQRARLLSPSPSQQQRRTIFIQTQDTPNQDALKFLPSQRVLPDGFSAPFVEYLTPRSTLAAPHPSPLAAQLLAVDGVSAVFYGPDYITVTKAADVPWAHVKPEVFSLITEAVTSGQPMVNTVSGGAGAEEGAEGSSGGEHQDSLQIDEADDEVVQMIKELLDTRIRPAIQEDGGDIDFRGFKDGNVLLKLRGACRTCDSSTVTLKNGIESMLMHYIEEVKGVQQVLDEEEEVAIEEFAKFEEKLKRSKGDAAVASTGGKGTLDAADA